MKWLFWGFIFNNTKNIAEAICTKPYYMEILMKIAIASDHAGYDYKELTREFLLKEGYEIEDFGTCSNHSCDYLDFVVPAAQAVADKRCDIGILLGEDGNGEAIAANKISGIRCAIAWNKESARLGKEHNNANMLSIGQEMVSDEDLLEILDNWLKVSFKGGRYKKRINKLESILSH